MMKFLVYAWGDYRWLAGVLAKRLGGEVADLGLNPQGHNFSGALRSVLLRVEEPVVYLTPADQFPVEPVPPLKDQEWHLLKRGCLLRLGVTSDPAMESHGAKVREHKGRALVRCEEWQHCSHAGGMGLDAALWNRALLTSLLEPGWTMEHVSVHRSEWLRRERPDLACEQYVPPLFQSVKLVDAARPKALARLDQLTPEDRAAVLAAKPDDWRVA